MQRKGRSRKSVISELRKIKQEDAKYEDGTILCSMCSKPHSIAKTAHQMFLDANLGDPALFPGTARMEKEVIRKLSMLLNCKSGAGFIVSGGTEANLMALLVARNAANSSGPEVVVPESAHFSFDKICGLLKLKVVRASLDSSYKVNPASVERCVNRNTVAIVATAGTPELGVVDPIDKLSTIALRHRVHLHVDAAFGGLVIPFLKRSLDRQFDFRLDGVKSVTVDPHKMSMSTIPAGGILFRDSAMLEYVKVSTPYLTNAFQYTCVGTRSGASVAATWAVFELLGREGLKRVVQGCMSLTEFLTEEVRSLGMKLVMDPTMNIVAFRTSNSKMLADLVRKRGWHVTYVPRLDCIRVVVMPHLKKKHLKAFVGDLGKALADCSSVSE